MATKQKMLNAKTPKRQEKRGDGILVQCFRRSWRLGDLAFIHLPFCPLPAYGLTDEFSDADGDEAEDSEKREVRHCGGAV
jgi:hypothetical protein